MSYMPFRRVTTRVRAALLAAGLLGLAGLAQAASATPSFGVRLQITGTCQVDSRAVFEGALQPGVSCRAGTPHALQVGRGQPLSRHEAPSADGTALIVTLTF